jgi:hypothetical protein
MTIQSSAPLRVRDPDNLRGNGREDIGSAPLRTTTVAHTEEILALIEREQLQDSGCGAIDRRLLVSVMLTADAVLWTWDRNLKALARRFKISFADRS